jgi:predicted HTH transcriptional regulator
MDAKWKSKNCLKNQNQKLWNLKEIYLLLILFLRQVIAACYEGGYPEPEWQELGTSMRVIFYPHPTTILEITEQKKTSVKEELAAKQAKILNVFSVGESLPFREIIEKLTFNMSERSLRYDLSQLRNLGYLSTLGKGRAIVWQRMK